MRIRVSLRAAVLSIALAAATLGHNALAEDATPESEVASEADGTTLTDGEADLDAEGISIPYPQRDVHLPKSVAD